MTLMKDLDKVGKKYLLQIELILFGLILYTSYTTDAGRAGLIGGGVFFSVIMIIVGGVMMWIPTPITTPTGIAMVAYGVLSLSGFSIVGYLISKWAETLGSTTAVYAIIGGVVLLWIFRKRLGASKQRTIIIQQPPRRI